MLVVARPAMLLCSHLLPALGFSGVKNSLDSDGRLPPDFEQLRAGLTGLEARSWGVTATDAVMDAFDWMNASAAWRCTPFLTEHVCIGIQGIIEGDELCEAAGRQVLDAYSAGTDAGSGADTITISTAMQALYAAMKDAVEAFCVGSMGAVVAAAVLSTREQ